MRVGSPTKNEYFLELSDINKKIQDEFLSQIGKETITAKCDVMLGDSTTKHVDTFDIKNVENFFSNFTKLQNWNSQGITYSSDEDLRRIFIKSEVRIGKYILSLHVSLMDLYY